MLLVSFVSITSASPDTRVTGYIGSHKLSFEGRKIDDFYAAGTVLMR